MASFDKNILFAALICGVMSLAISSTASAETITYGISPSELTLHKVGFPAETSVVEVSIGKATAGNLRVVGTQAVTVVTHNGYHLRSDDGGGGNVSAYHDGIGSNTQHLLIEFNNGKVALRTHLGYYFSAQDGGGSGFRADKTRVGHWELFELVDEDGKIALKTATGHYVVAEYGGGSEVNADRQNIGDWEKFTFTELSTYTEEFYKEVPLFLDADTLSSLGLPTNQPLVLPLGVDKEVKHAQLITLQSLNGQYLRAVAGGGGDLVADASTPLTHETFLKVQFTDNNHAMLSYGGYFVTARDGGGMEARGSTGEANVVNNVVGANSIWRAVSSGDHRGIRSFTDRYLVAEDGGGQTVNANRTAIGEWEDFDKRYAGIRNYPNDNFAFTNEQGAEIDEGFFDGDLGFNLGFDEVTLVGAQITYDNQGHWSGSVQGFEGGLFDIIQFDGLGFNIGYLEGTNLPFDAPVDPEGEYMFIEAHAGAAVTIGNITLEAPVGGHVMFVLDPFTVTLYVSSSGFFPEPASGAFSIDEVAVGFSAYDGLRWTAWADWHNEENFSNVYGNLYAYAAASIGIKSNNKLAASIDIAGDMLVDINWNDVVNDANFMDGMDRLAFNGDVDLTLGPDVKEYLPQLSTSVNLLTASVLFSAIEDEESMAITGVIDPADLGLPGLDIFKANAKTAMYFSNGNGWYIDFAAEASLAGVGVKGDVHIGDDGAVIQASVEMGIGSFEATGTIESNGDWSLSHSAGFSSGGVNFGVGKVKIEGDYTVTVGSGLAIGTEHSIRGCYKRPGGNWRCQGIAGSLEIDGDKIKICGKVEVPWGGKTTECVKTRIGN